MNTLRTQCMEPFFLQYSEMSEGDMWIKLAHTNITETCRYYVDVA